MALALMWIVMIVTPCVGATKAHHHKEHKGHAGGKWEAGNWSPCILDKEHIMDSEGLCRGYRLRFVICRVHGSKSYTDSECSMPSPARAIHCKTPCPQNCIVGPWSRWSSCSCHDSSSHRTRTVLVAPSQGGEGCPDLIQSRPCPGDCLNISPSLIRDEALLEAPSQNVKLRVGKWGPCQALRGEGMMSEKRQARLLEGHRGAGIGGEKAGKRTRTELPEAWVPPKRGL
ncbi:thrombospondin type-1 domain-containing protein 7A-like isoform X2 [Palaemon carinicauda]|uniref:thrombospondin type-1 domain-containing protein 7A-like isoform X2 n=1 Tax=Palaemon carinicauda TaxID=392227 RepID=UPI0035B5A6DD